APAFLDHEVIFSGRSDVLCLKESHDTRKQKSNFLRCEFDPSPIDPGMSARELVKALKKVMPNPGKGQASLFLNQKFNLRVP
ncbi:hypothetical protein ACTXML_17185, partial [Glutamicibacter arilaitensis]|uniref:hypothetical protein n=1 Tax=Glutamicibacter arilaitensis TaxID=256701 RepID=UPI003FD58FD1